MSQAMREPRHRHRVLLSATADSRRGGAEITEGEGP